jgi:trigger factor
MKKILNFLRENPLYVIVSLVSVLLFALDNAEAGAMLAAVTVVPAGSTKASRGIAGLATQGAGEATTVSNAGELSPSLIDADVDDQIARLRAAYATYEDAKEGDAVAEGDFVQIDYSGTVGGKSILELNPEAKVVASGEGFWTQVEDGRFLPEILEALKGMKAGETKEGIKAKFDKETAPEGLKGEKAVYTVTLKSFRRRILPTDAELVERVKAESFEKFADSIRESMEKRAVEEEAARRENEAVEMLMKKVDFDVPQSQVRRAMDGYLQEFAQRAQYSGLSAEYFEKNRDKILKDAEEAAERQVRLWYVLEAIAAEEKIEAKDEEKGRKVIEFVIQNAKK